MRASAASDGSGRPQADARPSDGRFPRTCRLASSASFREAFDQSAGIRGRFLVLWLRRGEGASLRIGVVASRRSFPRSVDRNRVKRLMREAYRLNRFRLQGSCDLVVVARRQMLGVKRQLVEADLLWLARRAGILKPGEAAAGVGRRGDVAEEK